MNFKSFLKDNLVILDGGMGTLLQEKGLSAGERPERWNITHKEVIREIHRAYYDAGSNVVCTNTFGANVHKFDEKELEKIIEAAFSNAAWARDASNSDREKFIALDIGPTGRLLKPLGDLDFEDAVEVFAKTVRLGVKYGADAVIIETMNDSYETKAALLAVKENCSLPVLVSNVYGADGKLMTGATPAAMAAMLEGMGADAIGANCSLGPAQLEGVVKELINSASVPVLFKPNAGLPRDLGGKTVYDIKAKDFALEAAKLIPAGVRVIGGCCGTTPEYIRELCRAAKDLKPVKIKKKQSTVISSYTHELEFSERAVLIGERINPTGKKRFKQAILENDMGYVLSEGVSQQEEGADVLDVNVGLPGIDEKELLKRTVCELQAVTDLPLQIDTSDAAAMEAALRRYNGKAMINSVNGKAESMKAVFPLAKKYGGVVVALTLDENGIPESAEGRYRIAEKILSEAKKYGIEKKDIIFDTLAMTVSADKNAAKATLEALRLIKENLGCHTILGVSNVSFGLPCRDVINGVFFALALENGLSAAIMNPYSAEMMKTYRAFTALCGLDENCVEYIATAEGFADEQKKTAGFDEKETNDLKYAIAKGFKGKAAELTEEMLASVPPLDIVNGEIIPALNSVGKGFESGSVYLPQLLMSAEAAKSAFEVIKKRMPASSGRGDKFTVVIATVHGDIHDIGKNIVKLLLENYGFNVVDLGKDVPPETVADAAIKYRAPLVGLSALMTTTVPAMEATIKLLREKAPWCKIVVGGAVLTEEYAKKIGADKYSKDAMETVRFAEQLM